MTTRAYDIADLVWSVRPGEVLELRLHGGLVSEVSMRGHDAASLRVAMDAAIGEALAMLSVRYPGRSAA